MVTPINRLGPSVSVSPGVETMSEKTLLVTLWPEMILKLRTCVAEGAGTDVLTFYVAVRLK